MSRDRKSECLEDMRRRILTRNIVPGADLDEAALCAEYSLSRTPMREIFQRLNGEGLIQIEQNRGAKVSSMDLATMRVFFQTAPMIYCNIARLAAENRTAEQLADLRAIQQEFRAATDAGDAEVASFRNHRFHEQIGLMAHNPYLIVALRRMLIDHTRLSQIFYRPAGDDEAARVQASVAQHDQMIEAIEGRNAETAISLTMDHWNLTRDRLERYVMPDPLPTETHAPEFQGA